METNPKRRCFHLLEYSSNHSICKACPDYCECGEHFRLIDKKHHSLRKRIIKQFLLDEASGTTHDKIISVGLVVAAAAAVILITKKVLQ